MNTQKEQLDNLIQEYDLFKEELEQTLNDNLLLIKINHWENESIEKIRKIAENTRNDLRNLIEKSKDRISKIHEDISKKIHSARQDDTYSEAELNHWVKQLKQLQSDIQSTLSIKLIENERSGIELIEPQDKSRSNTVIQDRFSKVIGSSILFEGGLVAKHTNENWNYEYILGEQLYSTGRHTISFKIEQNGTPYNIFFGCISSHANQNRICIQSFSTVGWFGHNQVYQHGIHNNNPNLHGYTSTDFGPHDILHLTFDCDKQQIELYHEDTNKTHILRINITKSPFPWQLLMVLTDKDDCVRILPKFNLHSNKKNSIDLLIE